MTIPWTIRVTVIATGFDKAPGQLPNKMAEEAEEAPAGPEPLAEEEAPKAEKIEDDPFEDIFKIFNKRD